MGPSLFFDEKNKEAPNFTDVIGALTSTFDSVLKIFSRSSKSVIVSKVTDLGFNHFSQTA